jgi:D-alanyl-lipoteichoic acid acyltransferase DltB (MBOAT superfamily)
MGINVIPNFNRPFFGSSMSEFWRRWHISLIKWLTDYVYTPLSFNYRRLGVWGVVVALMLTFIISGIWHGAALCFILWGAIQGVILSSETLTKKRRDAFERKYNLTSKWGYIFVGCLVTYLLFAFSLTFGASTTSVAQAFYIIKKIFTDSFNIPDIDSSSLLYIFTGASLLFIKEFMEEFYPGRVRLFGNSSRLIRWSTYYLVLVLIFIFASDQQQFIYFQF